MSLGVTMKIQCNDNMKTFIKILITLGILYFMGCSKLGIERNWKCDTHTTKMDTTSMTLVPVILDFYGTKDEMKEFEDKNNCDCE